MDKTIAELEQGIPGAPLEYIAARKGDTQILVHDTRKQHIYYSIFRNNEKVSTKIVKSSVKVNGRWELAVSDENKLSLKAIRGRSVINLTTKEAVLIPKPYIEVKYRKQYHKLLHGQDFFG